MNTIDKKLRKNLKKADIFHNHEVLHVSCIIAEMFENYIVGNLATESNEILKKKANLICNELWDFYGIVGNVVMTENGKYQSSMNKVVKRKINK